VADKLAQQINDVAKRIARAERIVCMTGAGVSAESGVPTFRDAGGLWEGHRPEEVATPEAFARDPALVWRFYATRRRGLLGVEPNAAHQALARLEQRCPDFLLVTQNVDGLHHRAGSRNIIALHGDIWIDRCPACRAETRADAGSASTRYGADAGAAKLPTCPDCGGATRPGVVWFGEMLPPGALERAADAAGACNVMLVIGTSSVVYPAASLATLAKDAGATVIEINLEPTPLTGKADATLLGKAGEIMGEVMRALGDPADD
jgi:NAD-dependent deacetylase